MPQSSTSAGIQRRPFGRHAEVQGSILALGGHHIGDAEDEPAAAAIINGAIDEQVEKLESFVEAMADGIIEKTELEKQQTSVVQAMKAVEGDLNDAQHEKVTRLLVELSAYNVMRLLHELQQSRLQRAFPQG